MTTYYRHTQFGTTLVATLLIGIVIAAVIFSNYDRNPLVLLAIVILTIGIVLFYSLRVEIREGIIQCRFGCGLIKKKFQLAEITEAQTVTNKWYYGWGIKRTPHGWLFNVSGRHAVEISLRSGKKYRIGTDEPERLVEAIRTNLR